MIMNKSAKSECKTFSRKFNTVFKTVNDLCLKMSTICDDDGDGKEERKKGSGFTILWQNNNFAWVSRFLLLFFAATVHIASITSLCSGNAPALRESGTLQAVVSPGRTLHYEGRETTASIRLLL